MLSRLVNVSYINVDKVSGSQVVDEGSGEYIGANFRGARKP